MTLNNQPPDPCAEPSCVDRVEWMERALAAEADLARVKALIGRAREWVEVVDPARTDIASTAYAHTNILRDLAALDGGAR